MAAPTERELIVADAIDAIFAADTERLLGLSMDSDGELIGALDENIIQRGANALSERIAESNHSGTSGSNIPMWT